MPKFEVITSAVTASAYTVEADTEAEAEEKFYNGEWINERDLPDYDIDSQEEVLAVNKIN